MGGSAQVIRIAEGGGASRKLTRDPIQKSIHVSAPGPEEQQHFALADISVADVRHDATIYIPIAVSGMIKFQEEQKWAGMQELELGFAFLLQLTAAIWAVHPPDPLTESTGDDISWCCECVSRATGTCSVFNSCVIRNTKQILNGRWAE